MSNELTSKKQLQLQTVIRIDDFPSFVDLKATYKTKAGTFEDVDFFIVIDLSKYCHKSRRYTTLNSTSSIPQNSWEHISTAEAIQMLLADVTSSMQS